MEDLSSLSPRNRVLPQSQTGTLVLSDNLLKQKTLIPTRMQVYKLPLSEEGKEGNRIFLNPLFPSVFTLKYLEANSNNRIWYISQNSILPSPVTDTFRHGTI